MKPGLKTPGTKAILWNIVVHFTSNPVPAFFSSTWGSVVLFVVVVVLFCFVWGVLLFVLVF